MRKDLKSKVTEEIELRSIECSKRVPRSISLQKRSKHVLTSKKFSKSLALSAKLRSMLALASGTANLRPWEVQTSKLSAQAVPNHLKHSSQGLHLLKNERAWNDQHLCVSFEMPRVPSV